MKSDVALILLAGGSGRRFGGDTPKQFLELNGMPLFMHSLNLFSSIPDISEVIVVCDPSYHHLFPKNTTFALPGSRRQDSVYHGLIGLTKPHSFVCIHDAARPFVDKEMVTKVISAAREHGASTTAMPLKFTVKESSKDHFVTSTPDRSKFMEVQTPQVIKTSLLNQGFAIAQEKNLTVTDDTSLVELLNEPVKLVEGSYRNIKITTPEDLLLAEYLCLNTV